MVGIDMYLQAKAMQLCTPNIPNSINELFLLLALRLKVMFYDEEPNPDNPVPVEIQIDPLDLLGGELRIIFWHRMWFRERLIYSLPSPRRVVVGSVMVVAKPVLLIHQNFTPIVKTIKVKIYNPDELIITCIIFKQQ